MKAMNEKIEHKLRSLDLITSYAIDNSFDTDNDRDCFDIKVGMRRLRENESELTKLLRDLRTMIPKEYGISLTIKTTI